MKKNIILTLALVCSATGLADAQTGKDPVKGQWANSVPGYGNSTWNFVPLGNGRYNATETGLKNARGTAVLTGNQLRIDYTTYDGAGFYIVNLKGDGTGTGTFTGHLNTNPKTQTWNVSFRQISG